MTRFLNRSSFGEVLDGQNSAGCNIFTWKWKRHVWTLNPNKNNNLFSFKTKKQCIHWRVNFVGKAPSKNKCSSLEMVLQPIFFFTSFGTERSQGTAAPAGSISSFNFFLGSAIWTCLKIFLFLKLISKETLFWPKFDCRLVNKRWLANNMTCQGDVRLCKLGGGWWLVK